MTATDTENNVVVSQLMTKAFHRDLVITFLIKLIFI